MNESGRYHNGDWDSLNLFENSIIFTSDFKCLCP